MRAVIGLATAVVLLGLATVPFFTPAWIGPAQERAEVTAWTGFDPATVRRVSDALVADLVLGPPDFDVSVAGVAVLSEDERGHLRDVRAVLGGFAAVVAVAAIGILVALRRASEPSARLAVVGAVGTGGLGLALVIAVLGAVAIVAFEPAFEIFHRLLFSGGNWAFDPARDRLVQLFPFRFWQETTIALGVLTVGLGLGVAVVARRFAAPDPARSA